MARFKTRIGPHYLEERRITAIECSNCGEVGEYEGAARAAAKAFYSSGWRETEHHLLCPTCTQNYEGN